MQILFSYDIDLIDCFIHAYILFLSNLYNSISSEMI